MGMGVQSGGASGMPQQTQMAMQGGAPQGLMSLMPQGGKGAGLPPQMPPGGQQYFDQLQARAAGQMPAPGMPLGGTPALDSGVRQEPTQGMLDAMRQFEMQQRQLNPGAMPPGGQMSPALASQLGIARPYGQPSGKGAGMGSPMPQPQMPSPGKGAGLSGTRPTAPQTVAQPRTVRTPAPVMRDNPGRR
jgi:hypothetical protein